MQVRLLVAVLVVPAPIARRVLRQNRQVIVHGALRVVVLHHHRVGLKKKEKKKERKKKKKEKKKRKKEREREREREKKKKKKERKKERNKKRKEKKRKERGGSK